MDNDYIHYNDYLTFHPGTVSFLNFYDESEILFSNYGIPIKHERDLRLFQIDKGKRKIYNSQTYSEITTGELFLPLHVGYPSVQDGCSWRRLVTELRLILPDPSKIMICK